MRRLTAVPFLLLGALGLLAAGAAILGIFQAPSSADLAVHNGAGETLAASPLAGRYSASNLGSAKLSFVFVAPDTITVVISGATGAGPRRKTLTGPNAVQLLAPVHDLLSVSGFDSQGPTYVVTEPIKQLLPANERQLVSGTYHAVVQVSDGYVVAVRSHIVVIERRQHLDEHTYIRFTRIGNKVVP